jgi:hypothetical protein
MKYEVFLRKVTNIKRRCARCKELVLQIESTAKEFPLSDVLIKRLTSYEEEISEKKRDFENLLDLLISLETTPENYDEDEVNKL